MKTNKQCTFLSRKTGNRKFRHRSISGLFIIGSAFVVILWAGLFVLNFDNHTKKLAGYTYSDLKAMYTVITDETTYNFMNHVLSPSDTLLSDSMRFTKLNCFTMKHTPKLRSFIRSMDDSLVSRTDRKYMLSRLNGKIYLWNNEKLANTWCLLPRDFAKINRPDTLDNWEKFRANFGEYGYNRYSKPVFNRNMDICVVEHVWVADWLGGCGEILLFKKVNGEWVLIKKKSLWVS